MIAPTTIPSPTLGIDGSSGPSRELLERRSKQLQVRIASTKEKIDSLKDDCTEIHLIHVYEEHLCDLKREVSDVRKDALTISANL